MAVLLLASCAAVDDDASQVLDEAESAEGDAKTDEPIAGLTGGVTVTELAVPANVEAAFHVLEDKFVSSTTRLVRSFSIKAPSGTTIGQRRRSALEALYAKTSTTGNFSLKKFCATLSTPITTAKPCASKIEATRKRPGTLDDYIDWSTDNDPASSPDAVAVKGFVQSQVGASAKEFDVNVDVGHWEDDEWWSDFHAHRTVLFDAGATKMVVFRFKRFGSL